jgi:hypothetical protein
VFSSYTLLKVVYKALRVIVTIPQYLSQFHNIWIITGLEDAISRVGVSIMRSKQRLEANRANAKRSTGPSTEPGKARSKMNALKHGLAAKAVVIDGEDPREFEALRAGLERDFDTQTMTEQELVGDLAALFGVRDGCHVLRQQSPNMPWAMCWFAMRMTKRKKSKASSMVAFLLT